MFPAYEEEKRSRISNVFETLQGAEFPEQAAAEQPTPEKGPFSSLFNYDQEVERQEQTFAKRQALNEKIARGNAVTDAFNLLISGLGGAKGATIPKKAPNQSVINALNDYRAMDTEQRERLDRLRMLELNNMTRDLQYKQGLEAEQRGRDFAAGEAEINRDFTATEKEKDRTYRAGETVAAREFAAEEAEKERQGRNYTEQFKADAGHYSYQQGRGRSSASKDGFVLNGVAITPDLEVKMIRALQELYKDDLNKPRVLKDVDRNENINEESVRDLFLQHWDQLAPLISKPSSVPSREEIRKEIVATPKANNQQQQIDPTAYNESIAETLKRTDMSYHKKYKFIRDAAMEGFGLDQAKAEKYAKELLGEK